MEYRQAYSLRAGDVIESAVGIRGSVVNSAGGLVTVQWANGCTSQEPVDDLTEATYLVWESREARARENLDR